MCTNELFVKVVPLSLRGEDTALLFMKEVVKIVAVNSSANYYTQCETPYSFIHLFLKCFGLLGGISTVYVTALNILNYHCAWDVFE